MARPASSRSRGLDLGFRSVRVAQHGDDGSLGYQLVQQPKQLGRQVNNSKDDTRGVAARPVEACDQAGSDRIGSDDEYDRRRRGCGFGCLRRPRATRYDRGHLPADEIGRQSRQPIWLIFRPAILEGDVPALDKSGVVEALPERIDEIFEAGSRRAPEKCRPPASPAAAHAPRAATPPPRRRAA